MKNNIFYPEFKKITYIFLFIPIILTLSILIYALLYIITVKPTNWYQIIIVIPITILIISILVNDIKIYKTMKYEFKDDGLYLTCGKHIDKINYDEIIGWEKKDLTFNPLASFRMPGFSLGDCYFSNEGTVKMYATSGGKNVLLIYTKGPKYGITPKDEEEFILELEKRILKK